jgi:hypothetical protein
VAAASVAAIPVVPSCFKRLSMAGRDASCHFPEGEEGWLSFGFRAD